MKVYAPGKIILSGEHAVVYGRPALAMAVNRYATATVTRELFPHISFNLADLAHRSRLSISGLQDLKERVKRKYHRFIRGEYSIRQVLHKPFELAQFAFGVFAEALNVTLPHGVNIHVQSDIPIGCGMGSSAATILCVMQAVSSYFQIPLSNESLYQLALEAENMQHGQSSGLDLRVAMHGGCLFVNGEDMEARELPPWSWHLIQTGTPVSTTGQCVERVAPLFRESSLADDFEIVTLAMNKAIQEQAEGAMHDAIRANHRLLDRIGVVPDTVKQFIAEVESIGGSAKVCGAGAIAGEHAGAVLVMIADDKQLERICSRFMFVTTTIKTETRGVHVIV